MRPVGPGARAARAPAPRTFRYTPPVCPEVGCRGVGRVAAAEETGLPWGERALALLPRVRRALAGDASGHDWAHVLRVRHLALRLAAVDGAPRETVELVALLHDVESRSGRAGHAARGAATARAWLEAGEAPGALIEEVCAAVADLSWSGGRTPATAAGRVVQDADRLDAIGAVGIARAFAYGGAHGRSPGLPAPGLGGEAPGETVAHFHDKLLRLAGTLHTQAARDLAAGRHAFLDAFLARLAAEAEGQA